MTTTDVVQPAAVTVPAPAVAPVTAVVVTAGVTPFLRRTLTALAAQTRLPAQVLLVDVGGPEGAVELLDQAFATVPGPGTAHTALAAGSFGQAVTAGLARLAAAAPGPPTPWLWLLHDDSAPASDALAELVRAVGQAPSVAVAGAKQRTWNEPERLLEVGVRTTRWGRRTTGVVGEELDQGQHDGRTDVLGVGLAGALVRRDVWHDLGGPDPALGPFGDGLDLSRRARLAGHRVVVVPSAVVRHRQASYLGLRADAAAAPDPARSSVARRRAQVHARLVAAPAGVLPLVALAALVAAPVRALLRLSESRPDLASAELAGGWGALRRPGSVRAARRAAASTARLPRRTLAPLRAGWRDVWEQVVERRLGAERDDDVPQPAELELGELAARSARRRVGLAGLLVVLVAATAVAAGGLVTAVLAGARLAGGALALVPDAWRDVWAAATSGWLAGGLGRAGPADPLLRVLAVGALPFGGHVGAVVALLVIGGTLLAGWSAWVAAGAATRSVGLRLWAALAWALTPSLLVAGGTGRIGAVLAVVALPWAAFGVVRALGVQRVDRVPSGLATIRASDAADVAVEEPAPVDVPRSEPLAAQQAPVMGGVVPVPSVRAAAGAAVAVAVVWAGAPSLLVPVLVALLVVVLAVGRRGRRLLLVPVPGLVLLGPLVVAAARQGADGWRLLVADPGVAAVADPSGPLLRLLGVPTTATAALVPSWVPAVLVGWWPGLSGAVVLVAAVLALLRGGPVARAVRVGWLVAATGLAGATVLAALPAVGSAGAVGPVYLGPGVALGQLGLLAAGLLGADRATGRLAAFRFSWRQPVAAGLVALAVLSTGAGAASWLWQARTGAGRQVAAVTGRVVPAVGQQAFQAPGGSRVLLLGVDAAGVARYRLLTADGVQLTDVGAASGTVPDGAPDPAAQEADTVVGALAAGSSLDVSTALGVLGVADVQVATLPAGTAASDPLAQQRAALVGRLDATAGLSRVTDGTEGTLWRVAAPAVDAGRATVVSWARLLAAGSDPSAAGSAVNAAAVSSDGSTVRTTLAAAGVDRLLVLASRSGPGWRGWLDGKPLSSADAGWRQGFTVPAGASGTLVVRWVDPGRSAWAWAQGVVLGLALLLTVPWRRRVRS